MFTKRSKILIQLRGKLKTILVDHNMENLKLHDMIIHLYHKNMLKSTTVLNIYVLKLTNIQNIFKVN